MMDFCFRRNDNYLRDQLFNLSVLIPFFVFLVILSTSSITWAGDDPFAGPANWGGTGLMETPTARIMKEGRFRFGVTQVDPYRYYYGAVSPIEGMEIDGRVTEALGFKASPGDPAWQGYGNDKDKSMDFKFRLLKEGKYWPAIALGINDPQGTRQYASQYIVASKQIYPFDITLGFGNGRFGKKRLPATGEDFKLEMFTDNSSWRTDGQFFGGIQFAPTNWLTLMAEYSPIQYDKQSDMVAGYFTEPVPSKFNFGIRLKPWDWLEADVSYQRGNQVGVNVSMAFELGNPMIPIFDLPYKEKPELYLSPLTERITRALYESGFSDIGVVRKGDELWIEAANGKYYYNMKAIGVALRAINQVLAKTPPGPPLGKGGQAADLEKGEIRKVHLVLTENGVPTVAFETHPEDLAAFEAEQLTLNEFLYVSQIKTDVWETPASRKRHWSYFDYGLKPDFKMFLNDPSGFFKYRFGVAGQGFFTPWKGATFVAGILGYPLNTVSSSNAPSSQPVRTDTVLYQQQKVEMSQLLFNQTQKFGYDIYGRVAAGYLEEQYAGIDGEVATPLFGGRITAGLSGSVVKKRDPDYIFKLKENDWKEYYTTAFFNVRLNIPEVEVNIDLKNGQFLAGDQGTVVTVSKNFNGVILSAWYSFTDTSMFKDDYNKGYHDKGVSITIPLRLFTGKDTKTAYSTGISPWTRDVAQDIDHFDNLFDMIGRNSKVYIDKDKKMLQ